MSFCLKTVNMLKAERATVYKEQISKPQVGNLNLQFNNWVLVELMLDFGK